MLKKNNETRYYGFIAILNLMVKNKTWHKKSAIQPKNGPLLRKLEGYAPSQPPN
jgi:hypothetical protein